MNAEIKQQWVEALRSGKYSQCKSLLKTKTGHCCLGVLEDILIPKTGASWEEDSRDRSGRPGFVEFVLRAPLPVNHIAWTSLSEGTAVLAGISNAGAFPVDSLDEIQSFIRSEIGKLSTEEHMKVSSGALTGNLSSLMGMNDHGLPFSLIADVIEKFF